MTENHCSLWAYGRLHISCCCCCGDGGPVTMATEAINWTSAVQSALKNNPTNASRRKQIERRTEHGSARERERERERNSVATAGCDDHATTYSCTAASAADVILTTEWWRTAHAPPSYRKHVRNDTLLSNDVTRCNYTRGTVMPLKTDAAGKKPPHLVARRSQVSKREKTTRKNLKKND